MPLTDFISLPDQQRIVSAIGDAECLTSGEIRVHIEPHCRFFSPLKRATKVFHALNMQDTTHRNGVLVYVAYKSHKFAIVGDCGINERVPADFWNVELNTLKSFLAANRAADGLCQVIAQIGNSLKEYFPSTPDDTNEQTNEISYSE